MKTINKIKTPDIGDLITFTNVWDRVISKSNKYPYGIVTQIIDYDSLLVIEGKENLIGTLAFPMDDEDALVKKGLVYIVRWSTSDSAIKDMYKLIHEEWFNNDSFIVVNKTN